MVRFLCDEMLQGLGRWLRAAGYDTAIAREGATDRVVLAWARAEGRSLITRDRELSRQRAAIRTVILLEQNTVQACARELSLRVGIDWLHAPFSRCLRCNTELRGASAEHIARIPPRCRPRGAGAVHCPACDRVYWEGGHVRRMRLQLAALNPCA